jgi:hypothetical protein
VQLGAQKASQNTPCEVFFLQFFSQKKETRTAELWGMYVVGEFFFSKSFLNLFFPKISKTLPHLLQTSEIHAPGQDTMQFLSSFLVL